MRHQHGRPWLGMVGGWGVGGGSTVIGSCHGPWPGQPFRWPSIACPDLKEEGRSYLPLCPCLFSEMPCICSCWIGWGLPCARAEPDDLSFAQSIYPHKNPTVTVLPGMLGAPLPLLGAHRGRRGGSYCNSFLGQPHQGSTAPGSCRRPVWKGKHIPCGRGPQLGAVLWR